jgi:hypothetical protein
MGSAFLTFVRMCMSGAGIGFRLNTIPFRRKRIRMGRRAERERLRVADPGGTM